MYSAKCSAPLYWSTVHAYVFDNINYSQKSKCFAWYNPKYEEVWFHYPSQASDEPDRIVRVNVNALSWVPDTWDRTAAEGPSILTRTPRLISSTGTLYQHETGTDDDDAALPFSLTSNKRWAGKPTAVIAAITPDSVQTGDITVAIDGRKYPQSALAQSSKTVTVTPTTEQIPLGEDARFWQWTISGNAVGQDWLMGDWTEEIQKAGAN